ncbi:MAG: transglycosylase SLT domain-containing protein [Alistipes sp.]|nr:transglycosylase SLT domain-containing protein [Alistipes sp.]
MKKTLFLLLILALTTDTLLAADGLFNRKKPRKRKKARTEQVEQAQPQEAPQSTPVATEPTSPEAPAEIKPQPVNDITLNFTPAQADSLVAAWSEYRREVRYEEFFNPFLVADTLLIEGTDSLANAQKDALYAQRLLNLASPIPMPYNYLVRSRITSYVEKHPATIARVLGLARLYFPFIEDELLKAGIPIELRALPIIESALQTGAVSRAGAVGLWQFMPSTGKSYGLEINSLVDERRDPIASTRAACLFLKELHRIFGDWTLAIAAYNCGPGNVNKAIARSGGKTFWDIYYYLPSETRGYVPAFIGATYAFNYHRQHNIEPIEAPIPLAVDTIRINRITHLQQISSTLDIDIEVLRALNPQYRLDIIPATTKPYTLVLPQRHVTQYIEREAEIMGKDSLYLKEYINPSNIDKKRMEQAVTIYRIKRGDTLGGITRRHGVTVKQLMRWNGIKNAARIREGQRLRIER